MSTAVQKTMSNGVVLEIKRKLSKELKLENPDVFHPPIRTHPADGRKALWVSTGTVKQVVGMPNPDGLDLFVFL